MNSATNTITGVSHQVPFNTHISKIQHYKIITPLSVSPVIHGSYPPTPALAKAGAAPGTTGGVEPALSRPWPSHSSNNCLSVFQRFAKLQRPHTRRGNSHDQTFPQAFPRQLSQLHAPAICFSGFHHFYLFGGSNTML